MKPKLDISLWPSCLLIAPFRLATGPVWQVILEASRGEAASPEARKRVTWRPHDFPSGKTPGTYCPFRSGQEGAGGVRIPGMQRVLCCWVGIGYCGGGGGGWDSLDVQRKTRGITKCAMSFRGNNQF